MAQHGELMKEFAMPGARFGDIGRFRQALDSWCAVVDRGGRELARMAKMPGRVAEVYDSWRGRRRCSAGLRLGCRAEERARREATPRLDGVPTRGPKHAGKSGYKGDGTSSSSTSGIARGEVSR